MMMMAALLLCGGSTVIGSGAQAKGVCSDALGGEPAVPLAMARIVGPSPRSYFVQSESPKTPDCPSTAAQCRARAFVVPGDDLVVVGGPVAGFRCAVYRSASGAETTGFLPEAALAISRDVEIKPEAFVGEWRRDDEASITLALAKGGRAITVDGAATYGGSDPERVKRGDVNAGELSGTVEPQGNSLALGDGYDGVGAPMPTDNFDCRARLRLFGRYLAVEDNSACGGMNVTFSGFYTRTK